MRKLSMVGLTLLRLPRLRQPLETARRENALPPF
jgi:hypothetical protein